MRALLAVLGLVVAQAASGADFRSVADETAVLYDAPSRAATPLWVVSHDYPLEVIVNLEAWVKVRDQTGTLSWIEKRQLSDKRTVLVVTATGGSGADRLCRRPERRSRSDRHGARRLAPGASCGRHHGLPARNPGLGSLIRRRHA